MYKEKSLFINGSVPEVLVPFRRQRDVVGDVVGDAAMEGETPACSASSSNLGKTPDGSGFGAFLSAFLSHDSADWKSCTGNPFRAGPGICRIFWGMVCRFTKISNVMP